MVIQSGSPLGQNPAYRPSARIYLDKILQACFAQTYGSAFLQVTFAEIRIDALLVLGYPTFTAIATQNQTTERADDQKGNTLLDDG